MLMKIKGKDGKLHEIRLDFETADAIRRALIALEDKDFLAGKPWPIERGARNGQVRFEFDGKDREGTQRDNRERSAKFYEREQRQIAEQKAAEAAAWAEFQKRVPETYRKPLSGRNEQGVIVKVRNDGSAGGQYGR